MNRRVVALACFLSVWLLVSGCTMLKSISIVNGGEALSSHPTERIIPFDQNAHAIIVKARVNDSRKEYRFILDTAALTVVDLKTASELGLNGEVDVDVLDSAGKTKKVKLARLAKLDIGDVKVKDSAAVIADLSDFGCDGILGSTFLRFFRVTIDYRHRLLTFSDGTKKVPAVVGEEVIPFKPEMTQGFAPKIQCTIDKIKDIDAFIDTGYPGIGIPVEIMHTLKEFKAGEVLESEGSMSGGLIGSSDKDYLLRVNSLSLGNLEVTNVPVASTGTREILIGQNALSPFLVTLDYPAGEMVLKRYENDEFKTNVYGWGLALKRDNGRVIVNGLLKGAPAAKSGIMLGDEVLKVNSSDVSQFSLLDLMGLALDDGINRIELVYSRDGGRKMVVLKKEMLLPVVKR